MSELKFELNCIYAAIEGEGVFIGTPTIFVRFQGCSLKCKTCDSKETWSQNKYSKIKLFEVVQRIKTLANKTGIRRVSITGGSPLEVPHIEEVICKLKTEGFVVNIEESGQYYNKEVFDLVDFISCDYKTPSSGVKANIKNLKRILENYQAKLQIKAVVADNKDLMAFIHFCEAHKKFKNFIITPNFNVKRGIDRRLIVHINKKIGKSSVFIRMICQQHKFLFGDRKRA